MVPVRFVIACPNGHIDDFPWVDWAHSSPGQLLGQAQICPCPLLRFNYTGKTGLMGLLVKCEGCGAKARSLRGSAGPDALKGFACSGNRPWLGPAGREQCGSAEPPRVLQRGASNIYFAKVASSILIPPFTAKSRTVVDDENSWQFLTSAKTLEGKIEDSRIRMLAELRKMDYDELKSAVELKLAGAGIQDAGLSEEEYRYSEYVALSAPPGGSTQDALVLRPQNLQEYQPYVRRYFKSIVLVEKLSETRALTGFARMTPPPYREYDREDRKQLSLSPLSWLPAIRVQGEGIFIMLDEAALRGWCSREIESRCQIVIDSHKKVASEMGRKERRIAPEFVALHTLAHLLIRRLSFECGYGSSALRERIYVMADGLKQMSGILIYTAAGDCEGTMGGLVRQGRAGRFEEVLQAALEGALWCSSDPLCIESHGQGTDSLNLAACHACALVPETSCEEGNRLLDRGMLVGTPDRPGLGLFSSLVNAGA